MIQHKTQSATGLEFRRLWFLAFPMMASQLAVMGMGMIDTAMAGHLGKEDLAAVSLGSGIFLMFYVTLIGIPTALAPILSHHFGAKRIGDLARQTRQGLWLSGLLGILGMLLIWLIIPLVRTINLSSYTIDTTVLYLIGVSLSLPAAIIQRVLHAAMSAVNRPQPVMWIGFIGLILNIPLNFILMYGYWGFPKLGGAGCGFATALITCINTLLLWIYLYKGQYFRQFGFYLDKSKPLWEDFCEILRLGLPISVSFFIEVSLFSFITLLVVRWGEAYVAAQQVVLVILSMIYIVPQSLAAATSVRIGQSLGQSHPARALLIAKIALISGLVAAMILVSLLMLGRGIILHAFVQDISVLAVCENLLLFVIFFEMADATQTIASGALRGYKITKIPMLLHTLSFWVIGLGLGCILAFFTSLKIYGFWVALTLSLTFAAVVLSWYLYKVGKKRIHYEL